MCDIGAVVAAFSLASEAIKLSDSVADAISGTDRRLAKRLQTATEAIRIHTNDVNLILKRLQRARHQETKDMLLGMALVKVQLLLHAIGKLIRAFTQLWSRPTLVMRIIRWVNR